MKLTTLLRQLVKQNITLRVDGEQLHVQAPAGVMTETLRAAITKQKSELMTWLQLHETDHTHQALPQVLPRPEERHQPFPLTDIQHAYWIGRNGSLTLGNVSTHSYTEYRCCDLDVERLTQALNQVIARHEMLRAIVLPTGQQQILSESEPYCIPVLDLSVATPVERAKELAAVREELSHQVLPLEQCPLFDIRVTRLCATDWLLHISIDLLMFDVSSLYTIYYEWHTLYTNPYAHLPMTELSFRDYILAEEELKATSLYRNARNYWLQRVDTLPLGPELPVVDTPVATVPQTFQRHSHELDTNAWEKLKTQAQQLGISPSVLFLTVFATVLKSWSKQPWFTLNLTIFNRLPLHPDVSQIVGDFTSVTLVDIDFRRPIPFVEQCKRVHHRLWEGLEHHHFSGIEVMRELAQRRNISLAGLMPVIFTSPIGVVDGSSDTFFHPFGGEMHYDISQTPQIWLDHHITEIDGGVLLTWDTVDGLFPAGMVDDMFGAYCTLVDRLLTDADAWHEFHLSPIPPHQLEQRETVNATAAPISTEMLHTLFLKQVEPRATEPAIITPSQTLTYQELYQRANQVGHWLREQGTRPNTLVAVVMEKGWEQVVAVLGIQLAGAAYLPIDPNLPTERQHYLLAQGEVAIALTQSHLDERLTWPKTIQRLAIDIIALDTTLPPLEIVQQPTDLAYVIYTSGSTGLPKGVVIDHRGAVNTVLDVNRRYGVAADDRVLALSALNFDLSVYDIFGLLAAGGAIVLPDPDQRIDPKHWVELIEQHHVTVWNTVPALMQMLVEYTELQGGRVAESQSRNGQSATFPSYKAAMLHTIMLSGDWIPVTLPSRIRALWPDVQIYGMGGATEASIWSIDYPIEEVDPAWPSIPYGKPMTNQSFHVLDAHFNSCPTWVPGDLYIGGTGLALGYWQDEERTNASFFVHPQTGERLYKTGDLGRFFPDGNIEFLGREDFQVKIRGHRIELGEIETTLLQHDEVKEAVVNAVGDPKGNRQLVAYVVRDHFGQINGQASVETNGQTNGHINGQHSAAATPEATAFPEVTGVTLHDPLERLTFKLEQPGLRSLNGAVRAAISLPQPALTDEFRAAWLARQSYRQFVDRPIAQEQFSHFLTCLMQMEIVGAPLPKYRYPSAGGLYPIQSYVYLKPGQVDGVAAGFYYYQPATHQLLQLGQDDALMDALFPAVNQEIYAQSAFVLFLVAEMDAIQPMYGEMAQSFALLEAGYMSQLLMTEAPKHDLGLCPVGTGDETALRAALALTPTHQLLHVLAGGRIDPAQQRAWLQGDQPKASKNWQSLLQEHLAARLPDYMVPTHYVALDALPLTANGKVDRKALPVPAFTESQDTFIAPETDLEAEISTVLQKMAAVEQISITRDFFDLGVNSVQMVQLANHLRKELHREIPIAALFQHTTIRALATYLANSAEQIVVVQEQRTDARSRRKARAQARLAQRQRR